MIPYGFVELTATYECKWCKRRESITMKDGVWNNPVEEWSHYDLTTNTPDICSSDCARERDAIFNQAYANLEPAPAGQMQDGWQAEVERLRTIAMGTRGI